MESARVQKLNKQFIGVLSEKDEHVLLQTLTTLSLVVGNLVDHLENEKFARMPYENKRLQTTVTGAKGGLEFFVAMGWQKSIIEDKAFWTFDVKDPERLEALKAARSLVDNRKELLALKIEGAIKALEKEREERVLREQLVKERFAEAREEFNETQELRGGVKPSIANIPVKENPILASAAPAVPPAAREEEEVLGTGRRLDEDGL